MGVFGSRRLIPISSLRRGSLQGSACTPFPPSLPLPFHHLAALLTEPENVLLRQINLGAWPCLLHRQELLQQTIHDFGFNDRHARAGWGRGAGRREEEDGILLPLLVLVLLLLVVVAVLVVDNMECWEHSGKGKAGEMALDRYRRSRLPLPSPPDRGIRSDLEGRNDAATGPAHTSIAFPYV